jgi:mRNA interferase YafQ
MEIITKSRFYKDIKILKKRRKNFKKLENILQILISKQSLSPKFKNHPLVGNWKSCWELHIEPDWLLIYSFENESLILYRTGSHSDLF